LYLVLTRHNAQLPCLVYGRDEGYCWSNVYRVLTRARFREVNRWPYSILVLVSLFIIVYGIVVASAVDETL
jgi:hypothetical protein